MDVKHKLVSGDLVMLWYNFNVVFGVVEDLMVWKNTDINIEMPAYIIKVDDGSYVIRRESQLYDVEKIAEKHRFDRNG